MGIAMLPMNIMASTETKHNAISTMMKNMLPACSIRMPEVTSRDFSSGRAGRRVATTNETEPV